MFFLMKGWVKQQHAVLNSAKDWNASHLFWTYGRLQLQIRNPMQTDPTVVSLRLLWRTVWTRNIYSTTTPLNKIAPRAWLK